MDAEKLERIIRNKTGAATAISSGPFKFNVLVYDDSLASEVRELVLKLGNVLDSTHRFDDGAVEFVFSSKARALRNVKLQGG